MHEPFKQDAEAPVTSATKREITVLMAPQVMSLNSVKSQESCAVSNFTDPVSTRLRQTVHCRNCVLTINKASG